MKIVAQHGCIARSLSLRLTTCQSRVSTWLHYILRGFGSFKLAANDN